MAVLRRLAAEAAKALPGFDIEIVETHHNQKVDAPSGTAKLLLSAVNPAVSSDVVYGREGMCGKRPAREIGVHALRGGTVAGTHTVHFFGGVRGSRPYAPRHVTSHFRVGRCGCGEKAGRT